MSTIADIIRGSYTAAAETPSLISQEKSKAQEAQAIAGEKQLEYQSLQDYMSSVPAAGSYATQALVATDLQGQIQQREQKYQQEKDRVAKLTPEQQFHLNLSLDREQKEIDTMKSKLLTEADKHASQTYSLLGAVKDEKSWQQAQAYLTQEASAAADKAIKDKKIDPSNRSAFIKDQVKEVIGTEYNPVLIESRRNSMVTVQDQIKNKQEETANTRALAQMKQAENVAQRQADVQTRLIKSGDNKALSESIKETDSIIKGNNKMIEDYEAEIKEQQKALIDTKATVKGPHFWSGDVTNPDRDAIKQRINDLRAQVDSTRDANNKLLLNNDVAKQRIEDNPLPKETPTKGKSKQYTPTEKAGGKNMDTLLKTVKKDNPDASDEDILKELVKEGYLK